VGCISGTVTPPGGSAIYSPGCVEPFPGANACGLGPAIAIPFSLPSAGTITIAWSTNPAAVGAFCEYVDGNCVTWQIVRGSTVITQSNLGPNTGSHLTGVILAGSYTLIIGTAFRNANTIGGGVPPFKAVPVSYSITGAACAAPPPTPSGLHLVSASSSSLSLAANASAGATDYDWYVNGTFARSTPTPAVTLTGLAPSTRYTIAVYACNPTVCNQTPATLAASTTVNAPPTPTGLHVVAATSSSLSLAVNASAGATDYDWYVNGHFAHSTAIPSIVLTGLLPSTAYAITVYACNPSACNLTGAALTASTAAAGTSCSPACVLPAVCQSGVCRCPATGDCGPTCPCPSGSSCVSGVCSSGGTPPPPNQTALVVGLGGAALLGGYVLLQRRSTPARPALAGAQRRRRRHAVRA
jgi:MYXO-CTERM domain-containing protein